MDFEILSFEEKYRDDLIFMVLEAKDALGKVPSINSDLLDIKASYFDKEDKFWIAVDKDNRVIGSIGYNSIENTDDVWIHRLYVKAKYKHCGIGTALLSFAESYLKAIGKKNVLVHLGGSEYYESRCFYPKHDYVYLDNRHMKKSLCFKTDYRDIIGRKVRGIIDRPIGSTHPNYLDMVYSVNYGYIPEILGGDGEPQDVYWLGTDIPIKTFSGKIIAVYHRFNDNEDKWIAAERDNFSDEEILKAIDFQEKYFEGKVYR